MGTPSQAELDASAVYRALRIRGESTIKQLCLHLGWGQDRLKPVLMELKGLCWIWCENGKWSLLSDRGPKELPRPKKKSATVKGLDMVPQETIPFDWSRFDHAIARVVEKRNLSVDRNKPATVIDTADATLILQCLHELQERKP